jgi:AmmeMemoRadiSam system protein B
MSSCFADCVQTGSVSDIIDTVLMEGKMVRQPYVAGYFYPGERRALEQELEARVDREADREHALAVIAPHAGYMYSGAVAGAVYSSVVIPKRLVLLGPDHQSRAARFSLVKSGAWATPLGEVPIDTPLADRILQGSDLIAADPAAHNGEHSLEVQLPFLQYLNPDISIVPISIPYFAAFPELSELGLAIASAIRDQGDPVLIVASTDMSHHVSQETARDKDYRAIDRILALDARGMYETVQAERISMCGFQATAAALVAAKELNACRAELMRYQTSGDVTGDYAAVVGYAGIRIT